MEFYTDLELRRLLSEAMVSRLHELKVTESTFVRNEGFYHGTFKGTVCNSNCSWLDIMVSHISWTCYQFYHLFHVCITMPIVAFLRIKDSIYLLKHFIFRINLKALKVISSQSIPFDFSNVFCYEYCIGTYYLVWIKKC